jgi:hypothetical protein
LADWDWDWTVEIVGKHASLNTKYSICIHKAREI